MAPNPRTFGLPEDAHELVEQRTEHVKVFKTPSGTHYAVIGRRLHFRAEPGGPWLDPDELVVQQSAPGTWTVTTADISIQANYSAMTLTHLPTNTSWQWVFQGIGQGDAIVYDGIPWQYEPSPWGVKSHAVVSERRGPRTYDWIYLSNAQGIHVNEAGDIVAEPFLIRRPVVIGANGEQYETSGWDLSIPFHARFSFDDSVLPDEAFPYVIDPSTEVSVGASADDGYVSYEWHSTGGSASLTTNTNGATLGVRRQETTVPGVTLTTRYCDVALVRWNTAGVVPSGAAILGARLVPYVISRTSTSSASLVVEWYSASNWPIDSADHTLNVPSNPAASLTFSSLPDAGTVEIPLANAAANINRNGYTAVRLHCDTSWSSTNRQATFAAFEHSSYPGIRLLIEYTFTGTVSGTVRDATTNQPIAEATVTLDGDEGTYQATTDQSGTYEIADVPVGTYTITVTAGGYAPYQDAVEVIAGDTAVVDADLAPAITLAASDDIYLVGGGDSHPPPYDWPAFYDTDLYVVRQYWDERYTVYNTLLRFDTSTLFGKIVTGAYLAIRLTNLIDIDGYALRGEYYTPTTWPAGGPDYTGAGGNNAIAGIPLSELESGTVNVIPLENVEQINTSGYTVLRLTLTGEETTPTGVNQVRFASSEHPDFPGPALIVTYEDAPVGVVAGTVTDAGSEHPIPGATVTLAVGVITYQTTTGQNGEYAIADVPVGQYAITISVPGYLPYQDTVTVTEDQTAIRDASLSVDVRTANIALAAGGSLFSQDAGYEAARAGGRFTVSNNLYAGQTHTSAAGYSIFQALLAFNTSSLPENIKVRSSSIHGIIAAAGLTTTPYNLEARAYSWLPTVTADDWVVGDDLADLPLLGVAENAGTAGVGQTVDFIDVDGALREAVQARGTVELLIHSEHTRLGTPPGTSQAFYKQFVRTGPDAPVLIVEYVFTGTVVGVVRDAITNQPIAGATVMLTQVTPGDGGSATTGVDGAFTIPNVPVGAHVVTVSAPGYVPKDSPIVVTAETTVTLPVTLDPAPHEVVVAGIPSQEAIGNPAVLVPVVAPSIPSAEAFGIVVVSHDGVAVISIPSEESFGVPAVLVPVVVESIPSAEAFGIAIVGVPVDIRAESIRSAEAFGALAVRHGRFLTTPIARLVIAAPYSGKVSANSPLAGGIVVAAKWTGKITTFR